MHGPSFYSHCFTLSTNRAGMGTMTVLGDIAGSESHGLGKGEGLWDPALLRPH